MTKATKRLTVAWAQELQTEGLMYKVLLGECAPSQFFAWAYFNNPKMLHNVETVFSMAKDLPARNLWPQPA